MRCPPHPRHVDTRDADRLRSARFYTMLLVCVAGILLAADQHKWGPLSAIVIVLGLFMFHSRRARSNRRRAA